MERQIEKYFQEELNADERLDFLKQVESDNELKKQFIKFKNTYALLSFSSVLGILIKRYLEQILS